MMHADQQRLPRGWHVPLNGIRQHQEHWSTLAGLPRTAETAHGHPADPLNVVLIGTCAEVLAAFRAIGWRRAHSITVHSSLGIVASVLLRWRDPTAPVTTFYLFGRPQDVAFEREVHHNARERHHLRLWQVPGLLVNGRTFWLGAATFDHSVGIDPNTGGPTHHIAPDVDRERDLLFADLPRGGQISGWYHVDGVGATLRGYNAADDWYFTDGTRSVGMLLSKQEMPVSQPRELFRPVGIQLKLLIWRALRPMMELVQRYRLPSGSWYTQYPRLALLGVALKQLWTRHQP